MTTQPPSDNPESASRVSARFKTSDSEFEAKTNLFKAGYPAIPEQDEEKAKRTGFSSGLQYILAVIGMSVGLGNIWRFPAVAYANGGGAFLIPYLCMGILFGLPMLYIDSSIGQFMQNSPTIVFKQYFPAAQGIGWTMAFILVSIGFVYIVPCTWSLMYIIQLVAGRMDKMASCTNEWNTIHCDATTVCSGGKVYFNGTCLTMEDRNETMFAANLSSQTQSSQEEFFYFFIAQKHASFAFGSFNWMFAGCLVACWTLTALGLIKGVQSMGKVALVTTFLPYIIISILFFRGITLEGANIGIQYFMTNPNFNKLGEIQTWRSALSQTTFSLSLGCGPMIMFSSYNKRSHPSYRDCIIILLADTFMSVIGGMAIFSILGSMSLKMGKNIESVISQPMTLAFIAYPEATSHMPASTLWALLFFCMVFIIGITTMFCFVQGLTTCIIDEYPHLAKKQWLIVTIISAACCALNLLCFASQNGYHIFMIFDNFVGFVALPCSLILEVVVIMTYYGAPRLFRDIQCMHGLPTRQYARFFGNLGTFIKITVTFTAPLFATLMGVSIIWSLFGMDMSKQGEKIDNNWFPYPRVVIFFGFTLAALPMLAVPAVASINFMKARKAGEPVQDLFRISDDHPAVRYNLPEPVSWAEFFFPPLRSWVAPSVSSMTQVAAIDSPSIPKIPDEVPHKNAPPSSDAIRE